MANEGEPLSARVPGVDLMAARQGDAAAFDRLVRPMLGKLLALAQRLSAGGGPGTNLSTGTISRVQGEELLQEALIRAHRGLPEFRMDCSFRSWIVGILYRLASDPSRLTPKGGLPSQVSLSDIHESVPDGLAADPFEKASARDLKRQVDASMERLPVRQRTALHLRSVEGWGYQEIAKALDTSMSAARNAVMLARKTLRERLGDLL